LAREAAILAASAVLAVSLTPEAAMEMRSELAPAEVGVVAVMAAEQELESVVEIRNSYQECSAI
jgi:hypothetical protein